MRKRILSLLALLASSLGLSGGVAPQKVVMQLDWIFNAQFAGVYAAIEQGFYADAGIELELRQWSKDEKTVEATLAETKLPCVGVAEGNVLIKAHAAGAEIAALGAMFQGSPMGWMYLEESGIRSPNDFEGKRIGVHPDGVKVIELVFARYGLDIEKSEIRLVGHEVEPLLRGELDLLQGYYIDEYVKLGLLSDRRVGMIMGKDHGYAAYSQAIFAPRALLEERPELASAIVEATRKGWEYALANRASTVDLILRQYNTGLDRAYQIESLNRIADLVKPGCDPAMPPMKREVWEAGQDLLVKTGVLDESAPLDDLLVSTAQ